MKISLLAVVVCLLTFSAVYAQCPVGQMPNFDGSCIPDPNYNAGPVDGSGTLQPCPAGTVEIAPGVCSTDPNYYDECDEDVAASQTPTSTSAGIVWPENYDWYSYYTNKITTWQELEWAYEQVQLDFQACNMGNSAGSSVYNYCYAAASDQWDALNQIYTQASANQQQQTQPISESGKGLPLDTENYLGEPISPALSSVLGQHNQESTNIQKYYDKKQQTWEEENAEAAKDAFDATLPLSKDLVYAKWNYEDAVKDKVSKEEMQALKENYDLKVSQMRAEMHNNVLAKDSQNPDALWLLGTLAKWQGDNKASYEYYRDSLISEKNRNVFAYQQRLDIIKDPAMKMQLVQAVNPEEKLITLPTVESSPLLKKLKDNVDVITTPVSSAMRETAGWVEKMSRGFSFSNILPKKLEELNKYDKEDSE